MEKKRYGKKPKDRNIHWNSSKTSWLLQRSHVNEEERKGIPTRQAETVDELLTSPGRAQNSIYYENVIKE